MQENDREFLEGVNHGLALAAKDRGLAYRRVLADSDAQPRPAEIQAVPRRARSARSIATLVGSRRSCAHGLQQAIWSGAFVGTIVPPPATLLLNAPQYQTGKVLADAAIAYINAKLGGKADVVLLTQDSHAVPGAAVRGDAR